MFFRRLKPKQPTFEERLNMLRDAGFETARRPDGTYKVREKSCAAVIHENGTIERAGWMVGQDIALLVDAGYQKYWRVNGQRRAPALADQLKALHAFEEDLREALGLKSLYNTSLGTVNHLHLYDRVEGRDRGGARRPWR